MNERTQFLNDTAAHAGLPKRAVRDVLHDLADTIENVETVGDRLANIGDTTIARMIDPADSLEYAWAIRQFLHDLAAAPAVWQQNHHHTVQRVAKGMTAALPEKDSKIHGFMLDTWLRAAAVADPEEPQRLIDATVDWLRQAASAEPQTSAEKRV